MHTLILSSHLSKVIKCKEFDQSATSYIFVPSLFEVQERLKFVTYYCFTSNNYVIEFDTEDDMIMFAFHT